MYDFSRNCDIFLPRRVKKKVKNSQKAGKKPEEDGDKMPLKAPLIKSNHDRLPTIPYQKSDYIYIYMSQTELPGDKQPPHPDCRRLKIW